MLSPGRFSALCAAAVLWAALYVSAPALLFGWGGSKFFGEQPVGVSLLLGLGGGLLLVLGVLAATVFRPWLAFTGSFLAYYVGLPFLFGFFLLGGALTYSYGVFAAAAGVAACFVFLYQALRKVAARSELPAAPSSAGSSPLEEGV